MQFVPLAIVIKKFITKKFSLNRIPTCQQNKNLVGKVENLNKIKKADDNLTKKDSIEISEQNSNIINKKNLAILLEKLVQKHRVQSFIPINLLKVLNPCSLQ